MVKLPPWSFTNLAKAEQCLRQYHHVYVLKDIPFEETEASRWGSLVHSEMEKRLRDGTPLPSTMTQYESFVPAKTQRLRGLVEFKMGIRDDGTFCGFFADEVWLRGKLDFGLVDHEQHTACIMDWKTGKVREDPDELEIYGMLLKAKYPDLTKIAGWYVWLKEKRMGKVHDLSDANGKLASVKHRTQRIQEAADMDAWAPRESPLCGWCGVKTCEFHP
jgi:hypothetical protein